MWRQDELCFVQFIHPGGEHEPDSGGRKSWNKGPHKRKFVENPGRCLRKGEKFEGPLAFWTEWEPESDVIRRIPAPVIDGPRFVYNPFYILPHSYDGLQNTDPFTFGTFYYMICQQNNKKGPTQLRYLDRGSVILFGSSVSGTFVIDTVFVVDRWVDHNGDDYKRLLKDGVPPGVYWDVTLNAWYRGSPCGDDDCGPDGPRPPCRLYWGATVDDPVDGMFSYFPCQPATLAPQGFARPAISIPGITTDNLTQGKRLNRGLSRQAVSKHWIDVRRQVESAGLWLGVFTDIPERRGTST